MLAGDFLLAGFVPMPVLVKVARGVAGVVMVLPRHFFLAGPVGMAVLVEIPRLVAGMVVMLARLLLRHGTFLSLG